ncbi:hypothetical protein Hte_012492 [Hypoxylon texense]
MVAYRRREHGMKCRWPGGKTLYSARGIIARFELHLIHHNTEEARKDGRDAMCHWPGCNEEGLKPSDLCKHLRAHNRSANLNAGQNAD